MTQLLKHLFSRELDLARRFGIRLRRVFAALRRRPGPERPAPTFRPGAAPAGAGSPGRGFLRRWTGALSLVLSVALHALLFACLVSFALPGARRPESPREVVVEIRLRAPPPKPPVHPPEPRVEEEAPPVVREVEEPEPQAAAEEAREKHEPASDALAPAAEPLRREAQRPALKWVGLGGPPPLGLGDGQGDLSGRFDGRVEALERYGGSSATEDAVERGLRWLAAHQDASGRWDCDGYTRHCGQYGPCKGKGFSEFDVGVTSLALLAFLGAGHRPDGDGPFRENLDRGLEHLMSRQDGSGALGRDGSHYHYNHALASFALCEAYAITRREDYRSSVVAALRFSSAAQQATGGWDYTAEATGRSDLSITGWQIMALRSARMADLVLPAGMEQAVKPYLRAAFTPSGHGIYANKGSEAGRRGINMAAVGLLSYLYLGGRPTAQACQLAAERMLVEQPPDWRSTSRWDRTFQSYYYWYAASLCLFHLGGKRWEAWNHLLTRTLLPLQADGPHADGSWPPEKSWVGMSGGRVCATALGALTLEVYYRYKPLHATRRR